MESALLPGTLHSSERLTAFQNGFAFWADFFDYKGT